MFVVRCCCWLTVGCWLLFNARYFSNFLRVVCCLSLPVCRLLLLVVRSVACCLQCVVSCLLCVVWIVLFVVC